MSIPALNTLVSIPALNALVWILALNTLSPIPALNTVVPMPALNTLVLILACLFIYLTFIQSWQKQAECILPGICIKTAAQNIINEC